MNCGRVAIWNRYRAILFFKLLSCEQVTNLIQNVSFVGICRCAACVIGH
jgi:hypothetical protein